MKRTRRSASPKQPQPAQHKDWYAYYAGYSERFVEDVLTNYAADAKSVLDPWNGSGTTTTVAARRQLRSAGVDINPALTVVARARLTPGSVAESLIPLGAEILDSAKSGPASTREFEQDPLDDWLRPIAAAKVRAIEGAIIATLCDQKWPDPGVSMVRLADGVPCLPASTTRRCSRPFVICSLDSGPPIRPG